MWRSYSSAPFIGHRGGWAEPPTASGASPPPRDRAAGMASDGRRRAASHCSFQEIENLARDDGWLLDMREMPAFVDHHEACIRQAFTPQCRIGRRHDLVVVTPDDERRQFDAVQPLFKIGIEPARPSFATVKRLRSITSIC